MKRSLALAVSTLVLLPALAACGDDGDDDADDASTPSVTTSETSSPTETVLPAPPVIDDTPDPGEFIMETADDSVDVDGTTTGCDNPGEGQLSVTFADDGTTVTLTVDGLTGSVQVSGGSEFEGTVDSATLGDDGTVEVSGFGSIADDTATPTTFAVVGNCMPASAGGDDDMDDATDDADDTGASSRIFRMTTGDDSVKIRGTADDDDCDDPDESDLDLEFTGEGSTVDVDVDDGVGSVVVSGAVEFEGTVRSFRLGDDGRVRVTGNGSIADPGASPTTFRIIGSCFG